MSEKISGLTLIELLISMILMTLILLGFFSIDSFSRYHVLSSDRRSKVQNEVSYVLEHMSKYVQQANGDKRNPPIAFYPNAINPRGFQLRFDCKSTPADLLDDVWIHYDLSGNNLRVGHVGSIVGCVLAVPGTEVLTDKIVANFNNSIMPANPVDGFYANISDYGMAINIGLVSRYNPAVATSRDNPQVSMKTRLITPSSSAN